MVLCVVSPLSLSCEIILTNLRQLVNTRCCRL
nr:MAG TPA: hypothetical protein [Caudoviricetes sp.]DAF31804.1 MAG TPA: hypothetical protein [Caudoviricetes sp.]